METLQIMMNVMNRRDSDFLYIKINGKISKDYYEVIFPLFLQKVKKGKRINLILELEDFDYLESPFLPENFDVNFEDFNKIAIVGNHKWMKWIAGMGNPKLSNHILFFNQEEKEKAKKWISDNHSSQNR